MTNKIAKIEQQSVTRDYGYLGTEAIVTHPQYGLILIVDSYGGEHTMDGGAVRWIHGAAYQLQPGDTLESLTGLTYNEHVAGIEVVIRQLDPVRPCLTDVSGHAISRIAALAGL